MTKKRRQHKLNEEIFTPNVRITGDDIESKVVTRQEAFNMALEMGKDMILISEANGIGVVRIEDYNKFIYNKEKREKESKKNSQKTELKELGLSVNIGVNDLNVKIRKALEFLEDGHKVKLNLLLKSREKASPERGELVIYKFLDAVKEKGIPEALPKYENSKWFVLIKQKK